ncbi:MAG: ATP-binding protein [Symploca sp. SIO3C6]|uniref:ATP-binding protein n=1 Tax=Symploca sp. SIO1C4 TaxID=2607765 RepID=A0A6B3NQA9_9CYAN|nr:ATP-binding protein [Symploca sp. SIO3C6]NER31691.1 ATP-binding protein [Symploca sp. SIO1C4]NET07616.1 ATP-binding protein [Symploca sp. SIO2B6]
MTLDLFKFYEAMDPTKPLAVENPEDKKYYIDLSSVRGTNLIQELKDKITFFSRGKPTCQMFTGHIGCGKSTELLVLKAQLEQENFHVVYFESSQYLEMGDVDVSDILLAIARQVSESMTNLDKIEIEQPKTLNSLLRGAARLLQTEIELSAQASVPGIGKVAASTEGEFLLEAGLPGVGQLSASHEDGFSLVALGIGKITARAKNSPELRSKLREYLEPRTKGIIDAINQELLVAAQTKLKQQGKQGLVVIVDNLDRVESVRKPTGRTQPEYLFVDRGEQLRQLGCHVVYTMPLGLIFSNEYGRLTERFGADPKVLPMVPVRWRDGSQCDVGMALLRQMVLARAFPDESPQRRLALMGEVFDHQETLDRLCCISGGHVRELLRLLNEWIEQERKLPLSHQGLEHVIRSRRNQMKLAIDDDEWHLLRQVQKRKQVRGDGAYQVLIRSRFVYEYRDNQGSWFDINPILIEAEEF